MDQPKLFISLLIIFVIGAHALPVLQKLQGKKQTLWPFMAYGMYRHSRGPGPIQTEQTRLIGMTSTGNEFDIDPESSGLSANALLRMYLTPMVEGDVSGVRQLADQLNHYRKDPVVAFRLESETYLITDSGVVREHKPTVMYRVNK